MELRGKINSCLRISLATILYLLLLSALWLLYIIIGDRFGETFSMIYRVILATIVLCPYGILLIILWIVSGDVHSLPLREHSDTIFWGVPLVIQGILIGFISWCDIRNTRKETKKRRLPWYYILFILLMTAGMGGILFTSPDYGALESRDLDLFMYITYEKVESGISSQQIWESAKPKGKRVIEIYEITCLDDCMPIKMWQGKLKSKYLPRTHIVVYGHTKENKQYDHIEEYRYFSNGGHKGTCSSISELDKLIKTTRDGTFEILHGNKTRIEDIPNLSDYDEDSIYYYLMLKNLISGDDIFLQYALQLLLSGNANVIQKTDKILRSSIISPSPPSFDLKDVKEYPTEWKIWIDDNSREIEYGAEFLFDEISD